MVQPKRKNTHITVPETSIEDLIKIFLRFDSPGTLEKIAQQIATGNLYPIFNLKLGKVKDFKLLGHITETPKEIFRQFKEVIINELESHKFDVDLMRGLKKIKGIHIIPKIESIERSIPEVKVFSKGLIDVLGKLCSIKCRFLDWGIHKRYIATKLFYKCNLCGVEIEIIQLNANETRGKYRYPKFCMSNSCKAKVKSDFSLISEKTQRYEAGFFAVKDLDDYNETEKMAHIFENYDYFYEKVKQINVNDELQIIGTVNLDYSDLDSRKDFHEITDYIEAFDFKVLESKKYDDQIVKELYEDFKKDSNYHVNILESIHSYSSSIYEYFIEKNLMVLNWITSDSFQKGGSKRNTLNIIIGGHRGLFKSSIGQSMQDILGISNVGILSGKDTTNKGLIPTTQRNSEQKNLVKRMGAIPYYNRKQLIIDESQYLDDPSLESMKALDDGKITRALDGTIINAPAETAIALLMNYKSNKEQNEAYNYEKKLYKNLSFPTGQESILDRFDLHYAIPKLSKLIKRILRRRLFKPPKVRVSEEIIYNYLFEAKKIYTSRIQIPEEMIEKIEILDDAITELKDEAEINTSREFVVLLKLIKGIAAMRLKKQVDDSDLEYLKKHLINTIIPFYDNPAMVSERTLNIDDIFHKTFSLLTELHGIIPISEHIFFMREYLTNHYFPKRDVVCGVSSVDRILSKEVNTSNTKYKKLLEKHKNVISKSHYTGLINNATRFIEKGFANKIISENVLEIFKDNKVKSLDYASIISIVEVTQSYSKELVKVILEELIQKGYFILNKGKLKMRTKGEMKDG